MHDLGKLKGLTMTKTKDRFVLQMEESKRKFRNRVANLILRFSLFCFYVILGMVIIVAIEQKEHSQRKSKLYADLQQNITTKYNISKQEFESLADAIYDARSQSPLEWSYGQGFSFAIQLLTTIGYGNITPSTEEGKVFCIIYALFGIPITVLMLSTVGEEMLKSEKFMIKKIETRLLGRQNVAYSRLKCLLCVSVTIFLLILIGVITSKDNHKDWTILDSFYCWFITFTTVGFGDFIPGHGKGDAKLVAFYGIYIILGLCAMSNLLSIIGEFASLGIFQIQFQSNKNCNKRTGNKGSDQKNAKANTSSL